MTPGEKNVVKSLVAVAWADGKLESGESGVIEGLLCGFDATDAEDADEAGLVARARALVDELRERAGALSAEARGKGPTGLRGVSPRRAVRPCSGRRRCCALTSAA